MTDSQNRVSGGTYRNSQISPLTPGMMAEIVFLVLFLRTRMGEKFTFFTFVWPLFRDHLVYHKIKLKNCNNLTKVTNYLRKWGKVHFFDFVFSSSFIQFWPRHSQFVPFFWRYTGVISKSKPKQSEKSEFCFPFPR